MMSGPFFLINAVREKEFKLNLLDTCYFVTIHYIHEIATERINDFFKHT